MKRIQKLLAVAVLLGICGGLAWGQSAPVLTLRQAESIALKNHPRIKAGVLGAAAAQAQTQEARAAELPFIYGDLTGVDADPGSRISAGGLNNPLVFSRYANGLTLTQLITDFGRTPDLVKSAVFHAQAVKKTAEQTRLDVLFGVDAAYYNVLRSQALLKVAEETVSERRSVADQVKALAKSKLKSGLDVSFAEVDLDESKLFLEEARNKVEASYMTLSKALGYSKPRRFTLVEEIPAPKSAPPLTSDLSRAFVLREDLNSLRLERDSARWYARAQGALSFPTVDLAGTVGESPIRDIALPQNYAVIGVNVSVPIFNGNLFAEEQKEAQLKLGVEEQKVRDLKDRIMHQVGTAQLDLDTAYRNLALTARLRAHAAEALDLAQARYNLGLSSIVELAQAQLNLTQAQIAETAAKYEYGIQVLNLDYQIGLRR